MKLKWLFSQRLYWRKTKVEHLVVVVTVGVNYRQSFGIAQRPTLLNFENLISHPGEQTIVCVFLDGFCFRNIWFRLLLLCYSCGSIGLSRIRGWYGGVSFVLARLFRILHSDPLHKNVGFLGPSRKDFPEEAGVKIYFSTEPMEWSWKHIFLQAKLQVGRAKFHHNSSFDITLILVNNLLPTNPPLIAKQKLCLVTSLLLPLLLIIQLMLALLLVLFWPQKVTSI